MVETHATLSGPAPHYNRTLHGILQKLNLLLEEELEALNSAKQVQLEDFAKKKISLFSQLRVLGNKYDLTEITGENIEEIKRLKVGLFANLQKLELQMNAMKELNRTIEKAVLSDQSDGTYTIGDSVMSGYV